MRITVTSRHTQATCHHCVWTHIGANTAEVHDKARQHRCGQHLWLTPAEFTHQGDTTSIPITTEWHTEPEAITW